MAHRAGENPGPTQKSRVVGTDCLIGWLGGGEGGEIVDEIGYKLKVYTIETNKTNNLRLESP